MSALNGQLDLAVLKTRLYSAVLSDVLDQLGFPNQACETLPCGRSTMPSILCGFAGPGST